MIYAGIKALRFRSLSPAALPKLTVCAEYYYYSWDLNISVPLWSSDPHCLSFSSALGWFLYCGSSVPAILSPHNLHCSIRKLLPCTEFSIHECHLLSLHFGDNGDGILKQLVLLEL